MTTHETVPIRIDSTLRGFAPDLSLGVVDASVSVETKVGPLWDEIEGLANRVASEIGDMNRLVDLPQIAAAREVFRACGRKPQKYRVSSEALLRRAIQGKPLYQVNNIVDVNNLISLSSLHSVGTYDVERLRGVFTMRIGRESESYEAIGKTTTEVSGLPVFADDDGPCGSPWSDSVRTMITPSTRRVMMVIIAFAPDPRLQEHISLAKRCLESFTSAQGVTSRIVS